MKSLHCLYTRFICLHVYFSIPAESHFSSQAQEERISVHFLCYMYEKDTLPFHKGYRKFHFKSWSWSMPQIPHLPLSNTSVIYACFSWGAMGWNIAWLQCVLYSAQMPVMKRYKEVSYNLWCSCRLFMHITRSKLHYAVWLFCVIIIIIIVLNCLLIT